MKTDYLLSPSCKKVGLWLGIPFVLEAFIFCLVVRGWMLFYPKLEWGIFLMNLLW